MGVLDTVLRYKEQKEAQENADLQAIPQAAMLFQQAKQQQFNNMIQGLTTQATLAKAGLIYDPAKNTLTKNTTSSEMLNKLKMEDLQGKIDQRTTQQTLLNQMLNGGGQGSGGGFGTMFSGVSSSGKPTFKSDTDLDQANRATNLRKEFNALPLVKDYQTVKNQVSSMDSLLNSSTNDEESRLALDQGLITMFNKITDPKSVVRESEYSRTPENLSLANRLSGAVEKLKKGGAGLTHEDRKALVFGAKLIANQYGKTYNDTLSNYQDLASKMKVDPELVVGGYGKHDDFFGGGETQQFNVGGKVYNIPKDQVAAFKKAKGLK